MSTGERTCAKRRLNTHGTDPPLNQSKPSLRLVVKDPIQHPKRIRVASLSPYRLEEGLAATVSHRFHGTVIHEGWPSPRQTGSGLSPPTIDGASKQTAPDASERFGSAISKSRISLILTTSPKT